jgi:hypothetical protein
MNQLIGKAEDTKNQLIPKKKFGFKKKTDIKSPGTSKTLEDHLQLQNPISKKLEARKEFIWTVSRKSNQRILLSEQEANDQDLTLSELENCVVLIHGHPGSLQLSKIKNCVVICGPVARSIFADNCEDCTFSFICQQLRLHTSKACQIYLHVTSRAIMEDSTEIQFTPNNYSYDDSEQNFAAAGLDPAINNWQLIGDFNWLSADEASPNWKALKECDKIQDWTGFLEEFLARNLID